MSDSQPQTHLKRNALRLTGLYVLIAATWIALSDYVIEFLARSQPLHGLLHTTKGLLFVSITGWLLYSLIHRDLQRIQRTEQRYRALFESSHDALIVFDAQGRYLDANAAALELTGYTRGELLPRTIADLTPPDDRANLQERIRLLTRHQGSATPRDQRLVRKDGQVIPIEVTVGPQMLDGAQVFLGVIRDVTERSQAAAALHQSETRFRTLVENAPLGVTIAIGGRNLFVNSTYLRIFGYSDSSEIIGRPLIEQVAPQCRAEISERNRRRQAGEQVPSSYEMLGLRKDGSEFPCQLNVTRIELPEGPASVAFITDITERKAAEIRIQQQSARASALAEISRALAEQNLDHHAILTTMAERTSQIVGDGCAIALLSADGHTLEPAITFHNDPELREIFHNLLNIRPQSGDQGLHGEVVRSGQARQIPLLQTEQARAIVPPEQMPLVERFGPHSGLIAPLRAHGRVLGTLTVLRREQRPPVSDDELLFIQELADRAALAVDNARLYYASQEEIIERRRAEAALRASEEQYRMLFDNHPQPLWVYDTETLAFLAVNDAAVEQYGYSRDELLRMTIADIRPSERISELERHLAEQGQRVRVFGLSHHRRKDGTLIDVEITRYSVPFAGRPARLVLALDVTERLRAEATLQTSEANLRAIFNSAHQSVMLIGPDYKLIDFNHNAQLGAKAVFGKQMHAGQSVMEYVLPADIETFSERFALTLQGQSCWIEKSIPGPYSTDWWEFYFTPIVLPTGHVNGITFIARNINERKQAEAALRETEERLRTVVMHAPLVLIALDRAGTITLAEGKGLDSLGLLPADLVGQPIQTLYPEDSSQTGLQRALAGEDYTAISRRESFAFETRWTPLRGQGDTITGVIAVSTDVTEREQAVARLLETEAREQAILHGTTDAIFLKDRDGRYLLVNPAAAHVMGCRIEDALGNSDHAFFPDHMIAQMRAADQRVMTSGQQIEIHEEILIAGEIRSHLTVKAPYRDANGTIQGVIGISRDISHLRQTIEALRRSEATNRALLNAIPDIMLRITPDGRYLDGHAPRRYERLLPPSTLVGQPISEIVDETLTQQTMECIQRTVTTGQVQTTDYHVNFAGKAYEFEGRFVRSGQDELLAIVRDVTHRKRMERALRDARDVYLTLVEEIPMLVWRVNLQLQVDFVNKRWSEFTGSNADSLPDAFTAGLIYPDDLELAEQSLLSAWQERCPFQTEYRMRRHDGVYRWMEVRGTPFHDEEGHFAGYVGICSDISERKQQEQIKDDFLALSSHELKTPLAALIGYIHLLERWSAEHAMSERINQALAAMVSESTRLNRLINDLLDVSRIQTGKLQMCMCSTNLHDLLQHCVANLEIMLPEHQWLLELPPGAPLMISADAQRMEQVITNLCTNAAKYSGATSPVVVTLRQVEQEVQIAVRDYGLGIPASDLPYIFDRFYQVQRPPRESRPGLGLGLFITHEIVRQHGGSIDVRSVEHGGSVFTILLPLSTTNSHT